MRDQRLLRPVRQWGREDFRHLRHNVGTIGLEDGSDAIYAIIQLERALDAYTDLSRDEYHDDGGPSSFEQFLDGIDRLMTEMRFVAGLESVVTHVVRHCLEAESAGATG